MRKLLTILVALAVGLTTTGCADEFNPAFEEPLDLVGPIMLEEAVVYLDKDFEQLVVVRSQVDDGEPSLEAERLATGERPEQFAVSADGRSLYLINRGDESLSIYDIGEDEVDRSDVPLDSVYDRITVDPEGEYILLSHSGEASDQVLQNLYEVGIVDLRDGVPDETRVLTLPTRAQNLHLMPSFDFDGEEQRIAVALAPSRIAIVDLMAERDVDLVRSVPLTISQAEAVRNPTQLVFDEPSEATSTASLFLIDDRSQDVTQIEFSPALGTDPTHKLNLSVNQLAAGSDPHHIAVLDLEGVGKRLLALDGKTPRFTLVDVASGESATFDLPMSQPADSMVVYSARDPFTDELEQRVLAYSRYSTLVAIIRPESISVGSDTPTLGKTVEDIRLEAVPSEVILDERADAERAVLLHPGGQDGFTILNLRTNRQIPFSGFNPTNVIFDGRTAYGIFGNTAHLVRFDLESGQYWTYPLRYAGRSIFLSPDKESVLIRHSGRAGRFTVMSRGSYAPEDARLYEHLFLDGLLDRPAFEE